MSTRSLTDRILFTGAVGITLTASLGVVVATADLIRRVHEWRSWAHLDHAEQWAEIPLAVLTFLALLALPAGACLRLARRRNVILSLSKGILSPLTPRSKYAVWSPDWRSAARPAAGSLRTRKGVRRSPAPTTFPTPPASLTPDSPLSQAVTRR